MKILWIIPYLPFPVTSGGKCRQYHLLRELSRRGHEITLLVQSKEPLQPEEWRELERWLKRMIVLPRRSLIHPLTLLAAVLAPWPLLATINGLSPSMSRHLKELLKESWDQVQVEHSYAAQPCLRVLKERNQDFILTEHNLESGLGGATYDRFPVWLNLFVRYDQYRFRRWEKQVFDRASKVIAVTPDDAGEIRRITSTPVSVAVNGVDCQVYGGVRPDPERCRVLFVGNYDYPPNRDAVEWLLENIMPQVWQKRAEARLTLVGHAMPDLWRQRWPDSRIEWCGYVDSLTWVQSESALFVAPLRMGGGSKLKVLEAMAAGLPLVSTAQGVSGLQVLPAQHYLPGESGIELADAIAQLLGDPDRAVAMGMAGREYVRQNHDWSVAADALEKIYAGQPEEVRS